jgi:hypothetical protein
MFAPSLTRGPRMSAEEGRRERARDAGLAAELSPWHGAGREKMGRPRGRREGVELGYGGRRAERG